MLISKLPVFTGTWPNANTQTDEAYANNTFFAHAWIGTTLAPALNTTLGELDAVILKMTNDTQTVLDAKDETLVARDEAVNAVSQLPDGVVNDATTTLLDAWSSKKISDNLALKQDIATAFTLAQAQSAALCF